MGRVMRLAIAGVGNNISALLQGVYFYRDLLKRDGEKARYPGIRHPHVGGMHVSDVAIVAAFDVQPQKVGQDLGSAIFQPPNNYPELDVEVPQQGVKVALGLSLDENGKLVGQDEVVAEIQRCDADTLLYSLPTGMQWAADGYAQCCLDAGVGFVNCTPEIVARNPKTLGAFEAAGIPLIGDDLASHLGTSIVHRSLLRLLSERGLTLRSSYQLNIGGNEDFKNLLHNGGSKLKSKKNALAQSEQDLDLIEVVPSAGYISHLKDNKVAILNFEAVGWGGTPISLDLKLKVQDSSNAAGVIIDLIRIAAAARRCQLGGFHPAASPLLKSPPYGHGDDEATIAQAALASLEPRVAAE
jgi:myo-inositol-1-phosphate synthase